jgi:hypothetical protein
MAKRGGCSMAKRIAVLLALLVLALLMGCAESETGIVVHVESDIAYPVPMRALRLLIAPADDPQAAEAPATDGDVRVGLKRRVVLGGSMDGGVPGGQSLPFTIGVVPRSPSSEVVVVQVEPEIDTRTRCEIPVLRRFVRFVPGRVVHVTMGISSRCCDVTCEAGEICVEGSSPMVPWRCEDAGDQGSDTCVPSSERRNGIDDDCDGVADEGLGFWWCDGGSCRDAGPVPLCVGEFATPEICNGSDDDCDGIIDEGVDIVCMAAPGTEARGACAPRGGGCEGGVYAPCTQAAPTAETCNSLDDDCDGEVDESGPTTYYRDADADGVGAIQAPLFCPQSGYVTTTGDCDDGNPAVSPGATEGCDGVDNDCDGVVDEGCACSPPAVVDCGAPCGGTSTCVGGAWGSCTRSPRPETCDGTDEDCDGQVDEDFRGRPCYTACGSGTEDLCPGGRPCDARTPTAETCNGIDDDCNGRVDDVSGEAECGSCGCWNFIEPVDPFMGSAQCLHPAPGGYYCGATDGCGFYHNSGEGGPARCCQRINMASSPTDNFAFCNSLGFAHYVRAYGDEWCCVREGGTHWLR